MSDGTYRRPGVYLEERLQQQPTQSGSATAVGVFAGVTPKGPPLEATAVASWSDFVAKFGGFDQVNVTDGGNDSVLVSYLPYAVFNYYQNGGRLAYIVRVIPTTAQGAVATVQTDDGATTPVDSFVINANGVGTWANAADGGLSVAIAHQATSPAPESATIMTLQVLQGADGRVLETFTNLSMTGVQGTRAIVPAINDPVSGSRYIELVAAASPTAPAPAAAVYDLAGGVDPGTPTGSDLCGQDVTDAMRQIDSPLVVSFQPYRKQDGTIVMPQASSGVEAALNSNGRTDCFLVWDGNPEANITGTYTADIEALAASIGTADSYSAVYAPWVVTPDPAHAGATITVPPSGSVQGMIARIDATVGPWRTPAGLPAVLSTAVKAEVKFTDTDQGELNAKNINVIRAVPGSGICVMGGRTRKLYGPDRYVAARRTLIYIEEALKLNTQWAVFENNDSRLWSSLRNTAQNILQPVWEANGLAGATAAEAYYVRCDATINTPQVVQSGEVRMEVGVALQYPAEFIVIRVSQFDSGVSLANEIVAA